VGYVWILIGRIVISFVQADHNNPIVRFLYSATEPVLERVRGALTGDCRRIRSLANRCLDRRDVFGSIFLVRSLYDLAQTLR